MVKRLMSVALVALLAVMALSACGSEDESAEATVTRIPDAANAPVGGSPAAGQSGGGTEAATEVDLELVDIAFVPKDFTIAANTDVVIHLTNTGASLHNFSVEELGIDEDVEPGQSKDVTINTGPATFDYICDVPGHAEAGMVGTITVAEPGAAPPAGGAATPAGGTPSPSPVTSPAAEGAETPAAAEALTVELQDIKFVPPDITVPANTPTTVTLNNTGAAPHTFTVPDLQIDEELQPGETREIEINAPAGSYQLICEIPGHEAAGMVGTVIVQ